MRRSLISRVLITPNPPPNPRVQATNSPPNSTARVTNIHAWIAKEIEGLKKLSKTMKKHSKRSMDANILLSQRLEQTDSDLKKAMFHKARANAPKNK
jgi:hypothetical protein